MPNKVEIMSFQMKSFLDNIFWGHNENLFKKSFTFLCLFMTKELCEEFSFKLELKYFSSFSIFINLYESVILYSIK